MFFRSALVVCAVVASSRSAHADVRHVVHPTDGGLAVSSNPCGQATRDYLERVVSDLPTIEIGSTGMVLTRTGFAPAPASDTFQGEPTIGLWSFGAVRWLVSVRPYSERDRSKVVIEIQLSRRLDEKVCYEKWQGTAR